MRSAEIDEQAAAVCAKPKSEWTHADHRLIDLWMDAKITVEEQMNEERRRDLMKIDNSLWTQDDHDFMLSRLGTMTYGSKLNYDKRAPIRAEIERINPGFKFPRY